MNKLLWSPKAKDLWLEVSALLFTLIILGTFCVVAFIGFIYPFPTYKYFPATVVYENEIVVKAEKSGVIMDLLVEKNQDVKINQALIQLSNRANEAQSKVHSYEIRKAKQQLKKYRKLQKLGSLSEMVVEQQRLAVAGLQMQQRQLGSKSIKSPYSGMFYFASPEEQMIGRFLFPGEPIGYLHPNDKKVLRVQTFPAEFRRFKMDSRMTLFSRDMDSKEKQMAGKLVRKSLHRDQEKLYLFGDVTRGYEQFSTIETGSQLNVGILITDKSLFEAFFDFDAYSRLQTKFPSSWYKSIERGLQWLQE